MAFLEALRLRPDVRRGEVDREREPSRCVLCSWSHDVVGDLNTYLKHLLEEHHLVIADVNLVCDVPKYLDHWRKRFAEGPLEDFCPVIRTNSKAEPDQQDYYLLCDSLPEDRELRVALQQEKLKRVLEHYEAERADEEFNRECLFCRLRFRSRTGLLDHMTFDHNFSVGHPDNLVFLDEFLDLLADRLAKLLCFFCEKTFKDRLVLKEHMRKKQHKRLNPQNKRYDKYYLVNYLEFGKTWEDIQSEPDDDEDAVDGGGNPVAEGEDEEEEKVSCEERLRGDDEDWDDWAAGSGVAQEVVCLVCRESRPSLAELCGHMGSEHGFDFSACTAELRMDFYDKVKFVNYFRRAVHLNSCPGCEEVFPSREELAAHFGVEEHWRKPDKSLWNRPEYFFPTYEDDNLLCSLDDDAGDGDEVGGAEQRNA